MVSIHEMNAKFSQMNSYYNDLSVRQQVTNLHENILNNIQVSLRAFQTATAVD